MLLILINELSLSILTCIKYSSVILRFKAASNGPDTTVDHGSLGIILIIIILINERTLPESSLEDTFFP